jgi:hypothetical protein
VVAVAAAAVVVVVVIHQHFIIVIGFSPVASHSSVLLFILGHLFPIILCKHQLMNISNLFI